MADETKSSEEQVSKEETTSKEVEPKGEPKEQPKEQPLTEERVQQMMSEATTLAKEQGRREMQGIKDREVADAQRRVKLAEGESESFKSSFADLDEETRKGVELAQLRSRDKQYQTFMQEEGQRKQSEQYGERLNQSLRDEVTALGLDSTDKRIDYATDEADYFAGRKRFSASVSKVLKENQGEVEKKMKDDFKNLEAGLRKELNLDSVDTTTTASGGDSDAEFKSKFGSGELPYTKENKERAEKLIKK